MIFTFLVTLGRKVINFGVSCVRVRQFIIHGGNKTNMRQKLRNFRLLYFQDAASTVAAADADDDDDDYDDIVMYVLRHYNTY